MIICADHSHAPVERRDRPARRVRRLARSPARAAARSTRPSWRCAPTSARPWCTGWSRTARASGRPAGRRDRVGASPASTSSPGARARRALIARCRSRRLCASGRAASCATRAATPGSVAGRPRRAGRERPPTACFDSPDYPDALRRVWAALTCATSGDVLLSAGPGWEFPDWGGADHVGGGSHGSLHHSDSLGALAFCGVDAHRRGGRRLAPGRSPTSPRWSARTSAPLIALAAALALRQAG